MYTIKRYDNDNLKIPNWPWLLVYCVTDSEDRTIAYCCDTTLARAIISKLAPKQDKVLIVDMQ